MYCSNQERTQKVEVEVEGEDIRKNIVEDNNINFRKRSKIYDDFSKENRRQPPSPPLIAS